MINIFCHLEVAQIKGNWSQINHIISLQELEEAAELAHANLLDSVKYMILRYLLFPPPSPSNMAASFTLWLRTLSRKVNHIVTENISVVI